MTDPAAPRRSLQATVEVVTYDPLCRKGFMRIVDPEIPGARVHFALGALPEPFKEPIVAMSRPLNYHREMTEEAFRERMREIRRAVVGARFRATLSEDAEGRPRMGRSSLGALACLGHVEGATGRDRAGVRASDLIGSHKG